MAKVHIEGDTLMVEMEGLDKLWALTSKLVIPLANVRGATSDPGIVKDPKGIRASGTHVPGVVAVGTFKLDGERIFWNVHDAEKAVVVELDDERYARLVVEVDDPAATVALIEEATGR